MTSIELAGVPGAGKTTLLEMLQPELEAAGITVLPIPERAEDPPHDWMPDYLQSAEELIDGRDDAEKLRRFLRRTGWSVAHKPDGLHPEGMVHQAWRVGWLCGSQVRRIINNMPLADVVVQLAVPADTARRRVASKQGRLGPINSQLAVMDASGWRRVMRHYGHVVRQARRRTRIVSIDTSGDRDAVAERLLRVTVQLLLDHRG